MKLFIALFFLLAFAFNSNAQSYQYSYTDPCTGVIKTLAVPINGTVSVYYYGTFGTFPSSAFYDGTFETWMATTVDQYQGVSPCSQTVGVNTAVNITQGQTLNTLSILTSLSAIADIAGNSMSGSTNMLGGAVNTVGGSSQSDEKSDEKNNQNGNSNNNNNSSSGSTQPNGTNSSTQSGTGSQEAASGSSTESSTTGEASETPNTGTSSETSGETGSSGETTTGSTTTETPTETASGQGAGGEGGTQSGGEGTGTETTPEPEPQEEGATNITAGSTQTVKGSNQGSGGKGSAAGKSSKAPTVVASSDFVGFNFKDSDVTYGAKATGGYTSVKWDGSTSYGVLADYTSALKGPNITGFHAWLKPGVITLASGTVTIGFDGRGSLYGTLSGGQMRGFKGKYLKPLKIVYMGTVSYGQVFKSRFIGTALIAGGMYDWHVHPRVDIKFMGLAVYAPYVSYYNDLLLKSPFVALPSIGVNLGITKKFKFNINAGGSWALGQATLNYTVTCGTRLIIGE